MARHDRPDPYSDTDQLRCAPHSVPELRFLPEDGNLRIFLHVDRFLCGEIRLAGVEVRDCSLVPPNQIHQRLRRHLHIDRVSRNGSRTQHRQVRKLWEGRYYLRGGLGVMHYFYDGLDFLRGLTICCGYLLLEP